MVNKTKKTLQAFFSAFVIVSIVLSQSALPLVAYAERRNDDDCHETRGEQERREDCDDSHSEKIDICHKTGDTWNFMDTPSGESLDGHLGHGDFLFDSSWGEGSDQKCIDNAPKTTVDVTVCKKDDLGNMLPGWTINLDWNSDVNQHWNEVTGQDGCAVFADIHPHDYVVSENNQPNWTLVSLPNGDGHIQAFNEQNGPYYIVNRYTPPAETATVNVDKIVCDSEADLPNWGTGGPNITSTTASDFLKAHPNCHSEDWEFAWSLNGVGNAGTGGIGSGDNVVGTRGNPWTTFNNSTTVPAGGTTRIWLREQFRNGYIPFSGWLSNTENANTPTTQDEFSAEFYCASDVLNYDNWDYIDPVPGETYHCIGFNVPIEKPLVCNPEENLIKNGGFETPVLSNGSWNIVQDINLDISSALEWLVAWATPQNSGRLGLEIQNNAAGSSASESQHAELDGDHPVTIWQDVPTIAGKEYSFSFKYSPRPGRAEADNAIQPKINGSVLGAVVSADGSANSNTVWQTITRTFIGTGAPMKVELSDVGSDTSFGGYVDDVSLICLGDPAPQCNASASSTIVSDTTTQVDGGNAVVLSPIHQAWTANIPGASWIWSTNPIVGPTNDADNTEVFTKTFNIVGTPTGGTLDIAADNNYSVKINGVSVPVSFDQNNFQLGTQDTYNVLSMLVSGTNTLEITVTNWEIGQDANPANNPAGLLYKLSITNNECVTPPPPVAQCSDDYDNDEDGLNNASDPGCHTDGNVNNPESYDPKDNSESNESTQCSDGISNDNDGLIDSNDPGCKSGPEGSWNPNDNDETDPTQNNNPGGGGSVGGSAPLSSSVVGSSIGSVLGASTSCGIYLDDFLKMGWKNKVEQVKKLQTFLNDYLKLSPKLPVNGNFGMQTFKAVIKFQEQESDLVLKPWVGVTLKDSKKGTGFVYKTTITRINNIMCPDLNLQIPPAVID